jgi:hypothetical protein
MTTRAACGAQSTSVISCSGHRNKTTFCGFGAPAATSAQATVVLSAWAGIGTSGATLIPSTLTSTVTGGCTARI